MKEAAHHLKAFETYIALGERRSLAALAKKLGISHASTKLWSRNFKWAARIEERERSVATLVEQKTTTVEVDHRRRNRQIVQAGIVAAARAIAEGRINPTLSDLDRMVRLDSFLETERGGTEDVKIIITWPDGKSSPDPLNWRDPDAEEEEPRRNASSESTPPKLPSAPFAGAEDATFDARNRRQGR